MCLKYSFNDCQAKDTFQDMVVQGNLKEMKVSLFRSLLSLVDMNNLSSYVTDSHFQPTS